MEKNKIKIIFLLLLVLIISGCSNNKIISREATMEEIEQIFSDSTDISESSETVVTESSSLNEATIDLNKICECEKTFKEPYPIDWSGQIMAVFSSGVGLGIKNSDQKSKYKQFYVHTENPPDGDSDNIRIKGKLIGITCAYYNTIFGECVGLVIADSIQNIK